MLFLDVHTLFMAAGMGRAAIERLPFSWGLPETIIL
jgi:hypothetical protein